jgi:fatty-acyl-CoA synthase
MRAFINCSEPVYDESHQLFLSKFSACGVRSQALSTCYAMAENTFAVTQNPTGQPARLDWVNTRLLQAERRAIPAAAGSSGASTLVSCGFPIPGTEVCIMDEHDLRLPDRWVGEIALRSDCMLSGYYRRPDLTAQSLRAGWYYTGDMGYLADGQLYVTGRKKDLIIVGGKNIYPQDLEAIANATPGLAPGRCVAFGLFDQALGSENIVMVCELEGGGNSADVKKTVEMDLRRRIVQRTEIALADVRLAEGRWLIKTSSGKISRSANRDKYIHDFLENETDLQG